MHISRSQMVGGIGFLLCVSAAWAQPGGQPGGGGFGGMPKFGPPQPGEILPSFLQDQLKLTSEQKNRIAPVAQELLTQQQELVPQR